MTFPRTAIILMLLVLALPAIAMASVIHDAVTECDLVKVQTLLKKNPEMLNAKNDEGLTPLALATRMGETEIVAKLLGMGADLGIGDPENTQPIHFAAASGIEDTVGALIDAGADIEARDDNGMTPFLFAVSKKKYGNVEYLIEKGADINARSTNGWAPILFGVVHNSKYLVGMLIEEGADLDVKTNDGAAPLHSAASYGRSKILDMLIENGADINAEDDQGSTPLCWALNPNSYHAATVFIEKGADVNHRDKRGSTPLHGAVQRGSMNIAKLFIENGADVNAMDGAGWTPLTGAALSGVEMVEYLLSSGADVNPQKRSKQLKSAGIKGSIITPLHMAARHGQTETVALLIEKGADVNAANAEGATPIHLAVNDGRIELVKTLLDQGAIIGRTNNVFGRTELHTAACKGFTEIVDLLMSAGASPKVKDKGGKTPLDHALYYGFVQTATRLSGGDLDLNIRMKVGSAEVLEKKYREKEAVVWHLGHSGWAIKTKNHFLIFDYFENPNRVIPPQVSLSSGTIIPEELADQNVIVFSSHGHGDHYSEKIFEWKEDIPKIQYVMGFEPDRIPSEKYIHMPPRQEKIVDGMKISTIRSTDEGVAFMLQVDGLTIFHAGDHANGHNESSKLYKKEIDHLADMGLNPDISFFPITGCGLGDPDSVREGVIYAIKKLAPKVLFPMHGGDATYRYQEFADKVGRKRGSTDIICVKNQGDRYIYQGEKVLTNL